METNPEAINFEIITEDEVPPKGRKYARLLHSFLRSNGNAAKIDCAEQKLRSNTVYVALRATQLHKTGFVRVTKKGNMIFLLKLKDLPQINVATEEIP